MSSGLRTALPGVLIALCLSVLAWFGWQSLKMDSILDEGYFVSVDLAFKPADHLEYERFTYGDDPREFAEPLRFVHWKDGSLNYDGERSVEINYDGQALRHPLDEQSYEEWRTSFGETPRIESHQLFHFEDDTLRVGIVELNPVRLEAKRGGSAAMISGQISIDDRIYDVQWYFSLQSQPR